MPNVLLVDDSDVVRDGLQHVLEQNPDAVVVVLTDPANAETIVAAARLAQTREPDEVAGRPTLSRREREVLTLLAEGLCAAQVARALFISESTAKTHISHLYVKLGAGNRAKALMTALRLGLLEQPARA